MLIPSERRRVPEYELRQEFRGAPATWGPPVPQSSRLSWREMFLDLVLVGVAAGAWLALLHVVGE